MPCTTEFLTQNLSPAIPEAYNFPLVAPYNIVFPIITFSFVIRFKDVFGLIGSATIEMFDALYDEENINFIGVRDGVVEAVLDISARGCHH